MSEQSARKPSVLVDYPGAVVDEDLQDIFVYVRPETNGVEVESRLLRVVRDCPAYHNGLELIYMANLPGEYMMEQHVIERHYAHKLFFAVHGARSFSGPMIREFESKTGTRFSPERILGGFEALRYLGMTPEGLFALWVDKRDVVSVAGQTVKHIDDYWIIGYDIPALVHKNTRNTDIAVMMFRSSVGYAYFVELVNDMYEQILDDGLVDSRMPRGRVFHYSRSPFEQILDGTGYLVDRKGMPAKPSDLSFSGYLYEHGISPTHLEGLLSNPVFLWRDHSLENSEVSECDIYTKSEHMSNSEALDCLGAAFAQRCLHLSHVTPGEAVS